VIGIIGLLIGVLMPALSKARAAANRTACLSNIRQLGLGVLLYCNDNHGWFPTCAKIADNLSTIEYPEDWVHWQSDRDINNSAIAKLLNCRGDRLKTLLRCPSDSFDDVKTRAGYPPSQGPLPL